MIVRKIFLILCNKGMSVILYKLHFLYPQFSSQPKKKKKKNHPSTFPSFQLNTNEEN